MRTRSLGCIINCKQTSLLFAIAQLVLMAELGGSDQVEKQCNLGLVRLPHHIEPVNYKLSIRPDLVGLTFEGEVTISLNGNPSETPPDACKSTNPLTRLAIMTPQVEQTSKTSRIILHADKDLRIVGVKFESSRGKRIRVTQLCRDSKSDMIAVSLGRELDLQSGAVGRLKFSFQGPIRDDFRGLCRTWYRDELTRQNKLMAVTQFQAAHARKAFPCFDEPNFKATFSVVIEHASHLTALSNMQPIEQQTLRDGLLKRVRFAKTPRMSIHLLAYAIGQFDHIESTADDGMKIAIWTPPGRAQWAQPALDNAISAYSALKAYFKVDLPLEKIDLLSIRCHKMDPMENWGLITLSERYLFADNERSDPFNILFALDAITREMSLSWLADLVTINWWDELWLNEGLATWITQIINERLYSKVDGELIYLVDYFEVALEDDALLHETQAISSNKAKYHEIQADEIKEAERANYLKVGAILRMLNEALGSEVMQESLNRYLTRNSFKNAAAEDLWSLMEESSGFKVKEMMAGWLDQPGLPLVKVKLSRSGRSLLVEQERFVSDSLDSSMKKLFARKSASTLQKWRIPVKIRMSKSADSDQAASELKVLVTEESHAIVLPDWLDLSQPDHWIKLNANFVGFYRVSYDDKRLLNALERPVRLKWMPAVDRLNFISDTWALFTIGRLKLRQIEHVLHWYQTEDNDAVIGALASIIVRLEETEGSESKDEERSGGKTTDGTNPSERVEFLFDYFERTGGFEDVAGDRLLRKRTRRIVLNSLNNLQGDKMHQLAVEHLRKWDGKNVAYYLRKQFCTAVSLNASDEILIKLMKARQDNNWEST